MTRLKLIFSLLLPSVIVSCNSKNESEIKEQESNYRLERVVPSPNQVGAFALLSTDEEILKKGIINFELTNPEFFIGSKSGDQLSAVGTRTGRHIVVSINNTLMFRNNRALFNLNQALGEGPLLMMTALTNELGFVDKSSTILLKELALDSNQLGTYSISEPTLLLLAPEKGVKYASGKVPLDLCIHNVPIGFKVELVLDQVDTLIVTEEADYLIQGFSVGQHKLKATLLDAKGEHLQGPFNTVERLFEVY